MQFDPLWDELFSSGLLRPEDTVLDYGCGQGDGVRALRNAGFGASDWDPHFASDSAALKPNDIVDLGLVLNVIEDVEDRRGVLKTAFSLTIRCLAVAFMFAGKGIGHVEQDKFEFHARDLGLVSARLRTYVAVAERLAGDLSSTTIFRIHPRKSELMALSFDDFATAPLSRLPKIPTVAFSPQPISSDTTFAKK